MIRYIRDKIEWHRMKKIAFDHPFFAVSKHVISEREAERLLREHPPLDVKKFLRRARIECGITEPIEDELCKDVDLNKRYRWERRTIAPNLRKFIVVFAAVLLITVFFVFTKPGISLAEGIYNIVVKVFNGTLMAQNLEMPSEVTPLDFSKLQTEFSSLEEIAKATGRAIIVPAESDGELVELSVTTGSTMMVVRSQYAQAGGNTYRIVQTLYNKDVLWADASSLNAEEIISTAQSLGMKIYFGQMIDGTVYATAYGAGFDLNIASTDLSIQELQQIVEQIQFRK